jgi:S-adenosyl-L-methionine hydrolase (adenosine-forming)
MPESRIVTFTSDFGLQDHFVGVMHGVVLKLNPQATVVDICHAAASYDVLDGAWTIAQAYRFFPPRTVHVVVVDPGVGSERRPIIVETDDYIFVAPDNGVLSLVEAREKRFVVRHVTAEQYFLHPVSQTFHGRDIFAPVAGWLSQGVPPAEFGPEISDHVHLALPQVEQVGENSWRGVVLKIDKFGNLITNIDESGAPELFHSRPASISILVAGQTITRLCRSYAEGADDEIFAIVGSSGYLEVAAKQASAAEKLVASVGTPIGVVVVQSKRD